MKFVVNGLSSSLYKQVTGKMSLKAPVVFTSDIPLNYNGLELKTRSSYLPACSQSTRTTDVSPRPLERLVSLKNSQGGRLIYAGH
jgi:hypothetical protein